MLVCAAPGFLHPTSCFGTVGLRGAPSWQLLGHPHFDVMVVRRPELCPHPPSAEDPPGAQHLARSLQELSGACLEHPLETSRQTLLGAPGPPLPVWRDRSNKRSQRQKLTHLIPFRLCPRTGGTNRSRRTRRQLALGRGLRLKRMFHHLAPHQGPGAGKGSGSLSPRLLSDSGSWPVPPWVWMHQNCQKGMPR